MNDDIAKAREIVPFLRAAWGGRLDAVVLFGSRARGDADEYSDWDLLVIAHGLPDNPLERQREWARAIPSAWRIRARPVLHTPKEWYGPPTTLALEIALDGIVLLDARGRMQQYIARLRRGLERTGWRRVGQGKGSYWVKAGPSGEGWAKEIWQNAA